MKRESGESVKKKVADCVHKGENLDFFKLAFQQQDPIASAVWLLCIVLCLGGIMVHGMLIVPSGTE